MNQIEKVNKLNEFKRKYKRSNKHMICLSYEDIGELINLCEEKINKKLPNFIIQGEKITISERLYGGLVRALAYKIDYQDKNLKLTDYVKRVRGLANKICVCKNGEEYILIHNRPKQETNQAMYDLQHLLKCDTFYDDFDFIESIYKDYKEEE